MSKTKIVEELPPLPEDEAYRVMHHPNDEDIVDDEEDGWPLEPISAPAVKVPTTRLLDMLGGWLKYVERDEFPDSESVSEHIADLYQEAGQFASSDLTPEEAKERIHAFLVERILPTLVFVGE